MRRQTLFLLLGLSLSELASAQTMTCTTGSGVAPQNCSMFHYHIQVWKPDTKTFVELHGVNAFASTATCETARAAAMKRNQALVETVKRIQPKAPYELNRFGNCHCDLTFDKTNPYFLDDEGRLKQLRTAEEINGMIREKLFDLEIKRDAEVVRNLTLSQPSVLSSIWPKVVAIPEYGGSSAVVTIGTGELRDTSVGKETTQTTVSDSDLPLVEISLATVPSSAPSPAQPLSGENANASAPSSDTEGSASENPSSDSQMQEPVTAAPADDETAEAAERFISYETARVNAVLSAASAVTDDSVRTKIIEASMQRLQLLSNLRTIIETSGSRSKLGALTRTAKDEGGRLSLATRLFGEELKTHWAPNDAKDMILPAAPEVANDPVAVLSDSTGRFSDRDRRLALYLFLASNSSLTSNQELWLSGIVENFLAQ